MPWPSTLWNEAAESVGSSSHVSDVTRLSSTRRPTFMTEVFRDSPQSLKINAAILHKTGSWHIPNYDAFFHILSISLRTDHSNVLTSDLLQATWNKEITLLSSLFYVYEVKSDEISGAFGTHGNQERRLQDFGKKMRRKEATLKTQAYTGGWYLNGSAWTGLIWRRIGKSDRLP
jgi:hypothetical protein